MVTTMDDHRAFIVWAHRDQRWSDERVVRYKESVAEFAHLLDGVAGLVVEVDLFHYDKRGIDFTRWGPQQVARADTILMVSSDPLWERWSGRNLSSEGAGAARESDAIHGLYDRDQAAFQERVLIVILPGCTDESIPAELSRVQRYRINELNEKDDAYTNLLRHMLKQSRYPRQAKKTIPDLPPHPLFRAESPRSVDGNPRASDVELAQGQDELGQSKAAVGTASEIRTARDRSGRDLMYSATVSTDQATKPSLSATAGLAEQTRTRGPDGFAGIASRLALLLVTCLIVVGLSFLPIWKFSDAPSEGGKVRNTANLTLWVPGFDFDPIEPRRYSDPNEPGGDGIDADFNGQNITFNPAVRVATWTEEAKPGRHDCERLANNMNLEGNARHVRPIPGMVLCLITDQGNVGYLEVKSVSNGGPEVLLVIFA